MSPPAHHPLGLLPESLPPAKNTTAPARPPEKGPHLKILVVDQDPRAAEFMEQLCRSILGNRLEHFATADSLAAATARLGETAFDVVLLDPPLEPSNGLESLAARTGRAFQTIVVSAHTELALPAFDSGVLDFVPKPVSRERLAKALLRVARHPEPVDPAELFLAARRAGRIDFIALEDLLYVEGDDKYSELVFTNGRRNFHDKALGRLEATLPDSFVRIHKSYLVRFTMVSRLLVLKGSRYFAELKNGLRLPVGRSRYAKIKSRLLWPSPPHG
jgi:two-component system response regulator LytT